MTITTSAAKAFLREDIGLYFDDVDEVYSEIDFANAPFDKPEKISLNGPDRIWAAVRVNLGDRFTAGLGRNPLFRTIGIATVMLFAKLNEGEGYIDAVAENLRDNYEGKRLNSGTIKIRNPRIGLGRVSNGWWQVNVDLPFEFDSQ